MKPIALARRPQWHKLLVCGMLALGSLGLAGCPLTIHVVRPPDEGENPPPPQEGEGDAQEEYNRGFDAGFARDDEYWRGYSESYFTVPDGPILYSGDEIPYVESPPFDAGYWDGVWYAYNDGYFVCYDYAFTIGFSEGYDAGFRPDWLSFLTRDRHAEYLDGSFADGYQDGFSEGRIFGAVDYVTGLPFDWMDAMWDYRSGTDLFIEEAGVGTGAYGPVYLYEYGTDPGASAKSLSDGERRRLRERASIRRIGDSGAKSAGAEARAPYATATPRTASAAPAPQKNTHSVSHRAFTEEVRRNLDVTPTTTPRDGSLQLRLNTTWLDRVNAYRAGI